MAPSLLKHCILLGFLLVPNVSSQSYDRPITDPTERVNHALYGLGQWYNTSTGIWETAGWWNSANILTMIGDFAQIDPDDAHLQKVARRIFANAVRKSPRKNPDPTRELPSTNSSAQSRSATPPYRKSVDPRTFQPHSHLPAHWFDHESTRQDTDNTAALLSDSQFDESTLLKDFTPNPYDWLDGYYDDDLWWALAWITAYDATQHPTYLHLAEGIFSAVSSTWGTNCSDGGVYWNYNRTYVNAITNTLFFSTAAHLANRSGNTANYLDWAQRSLTWFLGSGMLNKNDTINDGLDVNCANNNGEVWSYNQGVILGGLGELHVALGATDSTLLPLATRIAKAAINRLADEHGIIHDVCEERNSCGGDGTQFKGIFMRNAAKLYKHTGDEELSSQLEVISQSIWDKARKNKVFGNNWAGPRPGDGVTEGPNASVQGSALDGLVAGVRVGHRR
ncbi:glycosyl hydrolase family 76-domain-containing protein [Ampelomyces quisqualis]|uniref:Glycosyl hydrolase family 76-domain-containing protein n=1 Tax=Ampelomyces quisqualis TaxID=50730 RepID=A0A6A5QUS1_AMPQU|nr:glycosyl hydrolase family 76-domain-containing protein [Ampelomyces quisqualis]